MDREKGFDFVRALAAIGIVFFHFYCHSSSEHKLFLDNANGSWGTVINNLFFTLSGYLLHRKYGSAEQLNVKSFFYKRWKATIPAHLVVFLFAYFSNVCSFGDFFYLEIPKWRLVLSFIGMDCYAAWIMPTYAITGEWFLGAILVAYAVYPILRCCANCRTSWVKYAVLGTLIILYEIVLGVDFFGLPAANNPISCLLCFYVGMLVSQHPDFLESKRVAIVALLACIILLAIPLGGESVSKMILAGFAALIGLYHIGEILCRSKVLNTAIREISDLSYMVFLIHHRIIVRVLERFDSASTLRSLGTLLIIMLSSLVFSKILRNLMNTIFSSKSYTKFEGLFLEAKRNEVV